MVLAVYPRQSLSLDHGGFACFSSVVPEEPRSQHENEPSLRKETPPEIADSRMKPVFLSSQEQAMGTSALSVSRAIFALITLSWVLTHRSVLHSVDTTALMRRFSIDDSPYTTDIQLEDDAAGKTDIGAIVVMDGISDARVRTDHRHSQRRTSQQEAIYVGPNLTQKRGVSECPGRDGRKRRPPDLWKA